uniref:glycosyltransferase family 4 protein n=1 Tax=Mangrovimonas sp. TPBH4 TaxID=1645914 RepID=UPI000A5E0975
FQEYPLFYQPYLKLLVDKIKTLEELDITLTFFSSEQKKLSKGIFVMPSYRFRRLNEIFYSIVNPSLKKLSYPEIFWIKNKVDIVHLQHSFLNGHIKNIVELPFEQRPKIIITLRGADTYIKPWISDKWKRFYCTYGTQVDAFVTVSNHQKEYLRLWGINENKIHVIPISFGTHSNAEVKHPSQKEIRIISAFRMCWEKNIDGNLRVIKSLVEQGYKVTYDIYGDGHDLGQIFYLINRYGLLDAVTYKGKIDNAAFKEILPDYDFYLQLSISESAGATIIEAQSKGVPCIVSDSDGLPEMIIPNRTGYVVPYYETSVAADKIIELYNNGEKYTAFSEAAINFVNNKFSIEYEVKLLVNLYHKLLN